ncbi:YacL family protein [Motilimonas pumila]|uniref:UPF0231 family protein n=1 Tax=Motilimonas pumila TaxID=2303987 RepID=A0A418Y9U6_9GAMM|nr:YacL family protein [Motilimonas pumila]RJG38284.1 UPF0231 family protein [Motilimonas pumila]
MEFEFKRDMFGDTVKAQFSMGHEAVGAWLEQECVNQPERVTRLLKQIKLLQANELEQLELLGAEYSLFLNQEEAKVIANHLLHQVEDELEPDFHLYQDESMAMSGLEDFQVMLESFQQFASKG